MGNFTDADVVGVNLDGFKTGAFAQAGINTESLKWNVKPEKKEFTTNYQDAKIGFRVWPGEGSGNIKGDMVYDTPTGVGDLDFITAWVPDFALPGPTIGGGIYADEFDYDFERGKLCSLDVKFSQNKNIP